MTNPTSNFGWVMPTSTDLVTDLPADFEVFGQAVDTSMAGLKGGTTGQILSKTSNTDMAFTWITNDVGDITSVTATSPLTGGGTSGAITVGIQAGSTTQSGALQLTDSTSSTSTTTAATPNSVKTAFDLATTASSTATAAIPKTTVTAKGSIIAATAASTPANLSVGTDGQVLTADSTAATGIKWATAATGGMTLISQQTMTGSSTVQWTSIPATYKHLLVTVNGYNTNGQMYTRLNTISTANYYNNTFGIGNTEFYSSGPISTSANSNYDNLYFWVYNYAATVGFKLIDGFGYMRNSASADTARSIIGFLDSTTGAITSVQLVSSSGNFSAGTANLWGVS